MGQAHPRTARDLAVTGPALQLQCQLMELAETGKPALLIPTPGQTEQEYVAGYLRDRGHHFMAEQGTLDLPAAVQSDLPPKPYQPPHLTATSVARFLEEVLG